MIFFVHLLANLSLVFLVSLNFEPVKAGTKDGGGGGDAVDCRNQEGRLVTYQWDYLLTESTKSPSSQLFRSSADVQSILGVIHIQLERLNPFLGRSLMDFQNSYFEHLEGLKNPSETSALRVGHERGQESRVWVPGSNELKDLTDEWKSRRPLRCVRVDSLDAGQPVKFRQAVIRTKKEGVTFYEYDERVLRDLNANSPLQLSFLLVHEWLRDFVADELEIAIFNRLLHSDELRSMKTDAFSKLVQKQFRISLPFVGTGTYLSILGGDRRDSEIALALGSSVASSGEKSKMVEVFQVGDKTFLNFEEEGFDWQAPACSLCNFALPQGNLGLKYYRESTWHFEEEGLVLARASTTDSRDPKEKSQIENQASSFVLNMSISSLSKKEAEEILEMEALPEGDYIQLNINTAPRVCGREARICRLLSRVYKKID